MSWFVPVDKKEHEPIVAMTCMTTASTATTHSCRVSPTIGREWGPSLVLDSLHCLPMCRVYE